MVERDDAGGPGMALVLCTHWPFDCLRYHLCSKDFPGDAAARHGSMGVANRVSPLPERRDLLKVRQAHPSS
jgi:hypothetical protein